MRENNLQEMRSLFDSMHLSYRYFENAECNILSSYEYDSVIILDEGEGYAGFECAFLFLNGKLVSHAIYE